MTKLSFYIQDSTKLCAKDRPDIRFAYRIKERIAMKMALPDVDQLRFVIRTKNRFNMRMDLPEPAADVLKLIDDDTFLYLDPLTFREVASS